MLYRRNVLIVALVASVLALVVGTAAAQDGLRGRVVDGLLTKVDDDYYIVSGVLAYRLVPAQDVDLGQYVLQYVKVRVVASEGKWLVLEVHKTQDVKLLEAPWSEPEPLLIPDPSPVPNPDAKPLPF